MTTLVVLLLLINLQRHCFSSMLSYLHPVNKVTEARREVCRGYRSFKMSSDLTCPMSTLLNHPQIKLRFSRAFRVWNLIGSTTQGYFAGTLKDHTFFFLAEQQNQMAVQVLLTFPLTMACRAIQSCSVDYSKSKTSAQWDVKMRSDKCVIRHHFITHNSLRHRTVWYKHIDICMITLDNNMSQCVHW